MSAVAINRNGNVKQAIWGALDLLGDLSELLKNTYVAIKPNDTWASAEDRTACTSGDSVEAVIQYVKRYSPKRIVVTGGAGAAETHDVFSLMGIDRVIRQEGVEYFDHNRPPFVPVKLNRGPQEEVMVNPRVLEYETLISLAQHKVHDTATVTLTMKNIAMSYPAADYYGHPRSEQVHPNRFFMGMHAFIAAMCEKFPIDLGIIVGHPAMTEKGPIGGRTFETELTIASQDFVAADSIAARLLGFDNVRHIKQAAELGLGKALLEDIEVVGVPLDEAKEIFQAKVVEAGRNRKSVTPKRYSHR